MVRTLQESIIVFLFGPKVVIKLAVWVLLRFVSVMSLFNKNGSLALCLRVPGWGCHLRSLYWPLAPVFVLLTVAFPLPLQWHGYPANVLL
jgi:uncharacterized protein involved in cysteine biosynthesis